MINTEVVYTVRFPRSTGGLIEYTFHHPGDNVTSTVVDTPGTLSVDGMESNVDAIEKWRDSIRILFHPVEDIALSITAEYRIDVDANSIRNRPKAGNFKLDFTYNRTTREIAAAARPPFDVSWADFLWVISSLRQFAKYCKGDWSNALSHR